MGSVWVFSVADKIEIGAFVQLMLMFIPYGVFVHLSKLFIFKTFPMILLFFVSLFIFGFII